MKASYTKIRELPPAWFEFLADQRPLSDVFYRLENGRFRHGLLEAVITKEKQALLTDKELRARFDALAKLLDANVQMREFRTFLLDHESYVSQLANTKKFRENVLKSYLKICFEMYTELMKEYGAAKARKKEIQAEAEKQRSQWETVLRLFNDRFVVPFTLEAQNRTAVMLGDDTIITLGFTYHDGNDTRAIPKSSLLEALSTGEKKHSTS